MYFRSLRNHRAFATLLYNFAIVLLSFVGLSVGLYPYMIPMVNTIAEMLVHVDTTMVASSPIKDGEQVVVISGFPVATHRLPNLALLHTIGK